MAHGGVVKALLALLVAAGLVAFAACQSSLPTDASVYQALVEGGCLASAPDGGIAAVHAEHVAPDEPAWLACMYVAGSTIKTCAVPCTRPVAEAGTPPAP